MRQTSILLAKVYMCPTSKFASTYTCHCLIHAEHTQQGKGLLSASQENYQKSATTAFETMFLHEKHEQVSHVGIAKKDYMQS